MWRFRIRTLWLLVAIFSIKVFRKVFCKSFSNSITLLCGFPLEMKQTIRKRKFSDQFFCRCIQNGVVYIHIQYIIIRIETAVKTHAAAAAGYNMSKMNGNKKKIKLNNYYIQRKKNLLCKLWFYLSMDGHATKKHFFSNLNKKINWLKWTLWK